MKIMVLCTSIEFQNRATIEAISVQYGCIDVLCQTHIKNYFKEKTKSKNVKIDYLYSIIPRWLRNISIMSKIEMKILKTIWRKRLNGYDTFLFTTPSTAFLLPLVTHQKIIYLIIDPFLLMGKHSTYFMEKQLLDRANLVLTTSKLLKDRYIWKYFQKKIDNVYYWPNTVDLSIWDYSKMLRYRRSSDRIVIGYAGNMNEITTDLSLVDEVTTRFSDCEFEFAGILNFSDAANLSKMKSIMAKHNVKYLGFVPYTDIPKKVINWDICLMFDVQSEISEYVHHNKIYQYLALGKPVVVRRTHQDYEELSPIVCLCDSKQEFIDKIAVAITNVNDDEYKKSCINLAKLNSSDIRAHQFMEIVRNLNY